MSEKVVIWNISSIHIERLQQGVKLQGLQKHMNLSDVTTITEHTILTLKNTIQVAVEYGITNHIHLSYFRQGSPQEFYDHHKEFLFKVFQLSNNLSLSYDFSS